MYTLDTNYLKKQSKNYLIISVFFFLFGLIYETFSHNVYSNFMIFAFLIPLIFGSIASLIAYKISKFIPTHFSNSLYNSSIATFTIGSIIKGVLDIYGTTNSLTIFYPIIGLILLLLSIYYYKSN